MIAVEKSVPIPKLNGNAIYPWMDIDVGDSFLLTRTIANGWMNARTASRRYAPRKFIARKTVKGFRVWRIA